MVFQTKLSRWVQCAFAARQQLLLSVLQNCRVTIIQLERTRMVASSLVSH